MLIDSYLEGLNQEQEIAVKNLEGPLLVLAGAGSGKTRVVTCRIAYLLASLAAPHQILALTFTNKAAAEMQKRVRQLGQGEVLICTFHSLGAKILRECADHLGYCKDFSIYDEEDSLKVIRQCMSEAGVESRDIPPKYFKYQISNAKNQALGPDQVPQVNLKSEKERLFPPIYEAYQKKLAQNEAMDFDDLLFVTLRLLRECPEVLAYYQDLWRFVLIDEYQDTNATQYMISNLLVQKHRNLFVVGDPDQSIYSWRGADINNILNFKNDYSEARVIRLEQNYRSSENILEAANALISNNQGRYEKNLWSALGRGAPIRLYRASSDREEASFVVGCIDHHRKEGLSLNQVVIFYRTNAQSRLFEDALLSRGLPYTIVGGISFYQRREIKDLLAFLKLLVAPSDRISFERTINIPKRGFGPSSLQKIFHFSQDYPDLSLLDYCQHLLDEKVQGPRLNRKQKVSLQEYLSIFSHLGSRKDEICLSALVSEALKQSAYIEYLRQDKESFDDRKANVDELFAKAIEWEESRDEPRLVDFLQELSLQTTLDEAQHESIYLMTLHNGKGLEFDLAFLVGMEEDLLPHANSRGDMDAIEEERRLCYVGMTRAKKHLYMTSSSSRFIWQELRRMRQSRFLREIPEKYIEKYDDFYAWSTTRT